jgi:hypothetical protein
LATGARSTKQIDAMIAVEEQLQEASTQAYTLRARQALKQHL